MIRRYLVLLTVALLAGCTGGDPTGVGATAAIPPVHPSVDDYGAAVLTVGGEDLAVLVADTPDERRHGLMEVEELPEGVGMLFLYDRDREGTFWMANVLVPLSIAFVAADGTILEILDMEPCPSGEGCPSYGPGTAYRHAIEVRQSWFDDVGITVGDAVTGLPGS